MYSGIGHALCLRRLNPRQTDDDADKLISAVAETVASVPTTRAWKERIVLGGWNVRCTPCAYLARAYTTLQQSYIDICRDLLPGFPVAHIGFSLLYARRFLSQPDVHFNLFQKALVGPIGSRFIKATREAGRDLFVWTVNDEQWMEWSIRKQVDGVITDDPKRFLEVCDRLGNGSSGGGEGEGAHAIATASSRLRLSDRLTSLRLYAGAFAIQVVALVVSGLLWHRLNTYGSGKKRHPVIKDPGTS